MKKENLLVKKRVNENKHYLEFGNSALGNITRLDNLLEDILKKLEREKQRLKTHEDELINAKEEIKKPFAKAEILTEKRQRLICLFIFQNLFLSFF